MHEQEDERARAADMGSIPERNAKMDADLEREETALSLEAFLERFHPKLEDPRTGRKVPSS